MMDVLVLQPLLTRDLMSAVHFSFGPCWIGEDVLFICMFFYVAEHLASEGFGWKTLKGERSVHN